jgi:hypothetical protein
MDELDIVTAQSLAAFIPRWYGPPDRPMSTRTLPPALPASLASWYRLADRWSVPLGRDHVFEPPDRIETDTDRAIFWRASDNSDVYAFAPDELVYERLDDGEWRSTGVILERFLVYIAVYEAVYAPIHGLVLLNRSIDDILGHRMVRLEDPLWTWVGDGSEWYADDDLLAHVGEDHVAVAARHRDALGRFDGYDISWNWDSRAG